MPSSTNTFETVIAAAMKQAMNILRYRSSALILFILLIAIPAQAQETEEIEPALPDIAPREVEIRGDLELSLPALQRQPIDELAPSPAAANVSASRQPSVEPQPQPAPDIAVTSVEIDLPQDVEAPASPASASRLTAKAQGGRYLSRHLAGRASIPFSLHETGHADLSYDGSAGHNPFEMEGASSRFNTLEGSLAFTSHRLPVTLRLGADGYSTAYTLYGAQPSGSSTALNEFPSRSGQHLRGQLRATSGAESPFSAGAVLRYEGTRYRTDLFDEAIRVDPHAEERLEKRLGGRINFSVPVSGSELFLTGTAERADLDLEDEVQVAEAGAGARFALGSNVDVTVGGRLMHVEVAQDTNRSSSTQLAHELALEASLTDRVRLFLENRPGVELHTLASLFRENPYLTADVLPQPSLKTIDTRLGSRFLFGPVQLSLQGGFKHYPRYQYYEQADPEEMHGYQSGFIVPRYAPAELFEFGSDISVMLGDRFHASLAGRVRNGYLSDEETDIPYFAPQQLNVDLSYTLPGDRGSIRLGGEYESARPIRRGGAVQAPAYLTLDLEGDYFITRNVGVSVRLRNAPSGTQERWYGYPRPPLQFLLGVSWRR